MLWSAGLVRVDRVHVPILERHDEIVLEYCRDSIDIDSAVDVGRIRELRRLRVDSGEKTDTEPGIDSFVVPRLYDLALAVVRDHIHTSPDLSRLPSEICDSVFRAIHVNLFSDLTSLRYFEAMGAQLSRVYISLRAHQSVLPVFPSWKHSLTLLCIKNAESVKNLAPLAELTSLASLTILRVSPAVIAAPASPRAGTNISETCPRLLSLTITTYRKDKPGTKPSSKDMLSWGHSFVCAIKQLPKLRILAIDGLLASAVASHIDAMPALADGSRAGFVLSPTVHDLTVISEVLPIAVWSMMLPNLRALQVVPGKQWPIWSHEEVALTHVRTLPQTMACGATAVSIPPLTTLSCALKELHGTWSHVSLSHVLHLCVEVCDALPISQEDWFALSTLPRLQTLKIIVVEQAWKTPPLRFQEKLDALFRDLSCCLQLHSLCVTRVSNKPRATWELRTSLLSALLPKLTRLDLASSIRLDTRELIDKLTNLHFSNPCPDPRMPSLVSPEPVQLKRHRPQRDYRRAKRRSVREQAEEDR